MNDLEVQLITSLTNSVNDLSQRVLKLEESINKGRGGFMALVTLFGVLGTVLTAIKLFKS